MIRKRNYIAHINPDKMVSPEVQTIRGLGANLRPQNTNGLGDYGVKAAMEKRYPYLPFQMKTSCPHWSILKQDAGTKITNPNDTEFKDAIEVNYTIDKYRRAIIASGKAYSFCDSIGNTYIIGCVNDSKSKPTVFGKLLETNVINQGSPTGDSSDGFAARKTYDLDFGHGYIDKAAKYGISGGLYEKWLFPLIEDIESGKRRIEKQDWVTEKNEPYPAPVKYDRPIFIKLEKKHSAFSWDNCLAIGTALLSTAVNWVDKTFLGDLLPDDLVGELIELSSKISSGSFNWEDAMVLVQNNWSLVSNNTDIPALDDIINKVDGAKEILQNSEIAKTAMLVAGLGVEYYAESKGKDISKYKNMLADDFGVNLPNVELYKFTEAIKKGDYLPIMQMLGENETTSQLFTALKNTKLIDTLVNFQDTLKTKAAVAENALALDDVNQYLNLLMSEIGAESVLTLPNALVIQDTISKYVDLNANEHSALINLSQGTLDRFIPEDLVNLFIESETLRAVEDKKNGIQHVIQRIIPSELQDITQSEIRERTGINSIKLG